MYGSLNFRVPTDPPNLCDFQLSLFWFQKTDSTFSETHGLTTTTTQVFVGSGQ